MLNNKEPRATVGVKDLAAARLFYEGKLGLVPTAGRHEQTTITYQSGSFFLLVYQSANAGANRATAVTWMAGTEVAATVKALGDNGVAFESYDIPGAAKEGDVYVIGGVRIAWFRDPDGNTHAIVNR